MSEFSERYGPWALVTGASAGIGAEFGRQLASRGLNVVLVARRLDRLQSLANELSSDFGVETRTISADLSSSEPLDALLREIKGLEIGLLVNNAGVGTHGAFMENELGSELAILDLNCRAPMALAHALGSAMLARGRGGLIFVSSVFGFFPVPMMGTYAASKAYDLFFATFEDRHRAAELICGTRQEPFPSTCERPFGSWPLRHSPPAGRSARP